MKKPSRKQWALLLALLLLLLLGGGAWYLSPDSRVEKVKEMAGELFGPNAQKMSREERRQKWQAFLAERAKLTAGQRKALGAEFRKRRKKQLEHYFSLSPEEKSQFLDQLIDRMEARRRAWQENRRRRESGQGQGQGGQSGQDNTGRGGWGRLSPEDRDRRRKEWLDSTTPEERAQRDQFRADLRNRMAQRGLGGWGPRR
jgi:hypothetical protein